MQQNDRALADGLLPPLRNLCRLAVGETVILMTPHCVSILTHLLKVEGMQQNDADVATGR